MNSKAWHGTKIKNTESFQKPYWTFLKSTNPNRDRNQYIYIFLRTELESELKKIIKVPSPGRYL